MEPQDDRIARRLAEIRAQEKALDDEAAAAAATPEVIEERQGSRMRSVVFVVVLLLVGLGLTGAAVTMSRLAGQSMDDATRTGQATVSSCHEQGPVTTRGFGYWDSCATSIKWDDGQDVRVTVGAVFTSADVGKTIEVGDVGRHRQSQKLARADVEARPWLRWIGYPVLVIGVLPLIFLGVVLAGSVRRRR
ncbi:hypothetical protein KOI35_32925 [Actinoplanes bogorensis]|uniref:DUF3592 domain-containing protein n=1 Tax=Paractinoplanes bogorensis TaxID=1610840 RepID=A0ABS5YY05_9ACTN|nr:DUF6346 domain-containing protein [Actinoplanes bogorensis]MBU2668327.1 hypothetical protein [Actinoplanes bogorensis]